MEELKSKVFILPCNRHDDIVGRGAIISLASVLKNLRIPIQPDQLIHDPGFRNSYAVASLLQHNEVDGYRDFRVVMWIITKRFALEEDMDTKMMEWHQLSSNDHTQTIKVFLDCSEMAEYIQPSLHNANDTYFISSDRLNVENTAFANLHNTLHQILRA